MERRFEIRKREIEEDAKIEKGILDGAVGRLIQFGKPFFVDFRRSETRENAQIFLQGLLSDIERKNAESIAYRFGQDRQRIQRFLGQIDWDHLPMLHQLATQIAKEIGEEDGIIAFDPSAFEKDGKKSAGVARQYLGRFGKVDNGQVGTFMAYVTREEHALIAGKLFIPQQWNDDPGRCQRAKIPEKEYEKHKTRHEHCLEMLDEFGDTLPHRWVAGDDEIGRSSVFRRELRKRDETYLLAVPCDTNICNMESDPPRKEDGTIKEESFERVDQWRKSLPDDQWVSVDVRDGEKGPLTIKLVTCRVLARTENEKEGLGEEELLIVTQRPDGKDIRYDYYLSNTTEATSKEELSRVILASHRIEDCFRRAKGECGLADYEVQTWYGWHHHITMVLLASWFLIKEARSVKKKGKSSFLTFPMTGLLVSEQLRRYTSRTHPDWMDFNVQHRSLRREQARFYHYRSKNILPPRRINQRL